MVRLPLFFATMFLIASLWGNLSMADGRIYALVVGIDDYRHINPLHGAVNDAQDVASALRDIERSDIRLLLDKDVSRKSILAQWDDLTNKADDGDILIFHFAGHGGRADAIVEGHEDKDNMFLLTNFDETGPGMAERLVDNEVGHMLASEKQATVIFVADSCYAGGMARLADKRAATDLRAPGVKLAKTGDELAAYLKQLGEVPSSALDHVVWLYAQDQNKLTQEISIEGNQRGALSYAFANILRGKADRNKDGALDIGEIKRYVNKTVVRLTERRQRPSVNAGELFSRVSFAAAESNNSIPPKAPSNIRIYSDKREALGDLAHVQWVNEKSKADLIYDSVSADLIYKTGDRIGSFATYPNERARFAALQGAVSKWRLLQYLTTFPPRNGPELSLGDGPRIYSEGEEVRFAIEGQGYDHIILVNLTNNGTIQVIAPTSDKGDGLAAGKLVAGNRVEFTAPVTPPFGADHLVALASIGQATELVAALPQLNNSQSADELADLLGRALAGGDSGIDWVGLYTKAQGAD